MSARLYLALRGASLTLTVRHINNLKLKVFFSQHCLKLYFTTVNMGQALSSVPLCSRIREQIEPFGDDNNNVDTAPDNNNGNVIQNQNSVIVEAPAPAPVETSTPKLGRERDLGDTRDLTSDPGDSMEFGPGSDQTFGSDSGLEHSSDELELAGYTGAADEEYLDTVLDTETEEEEETMESLESGDLGLDRATTFRVKKQEESEEAEDEEAQVDSKLGEMEQVVGVTSRLSELDIRGSPVMRR